MKFQDSGYRFVICCAIVSILFFTAATFGQEKLSPEDVKGKYSKQRIIDEDVIAVVLVVKEKPGKTGDTGTLEITLTPAWDFKEIIVDVSGAGVMRLGDVKDSISLKPGKSFLPKIDVKDHRQKNITALKAHSPQSIHIPIRLAEGGYGYFMVKILGRDGKPIEYTPTAVLYFLSLDDQAFFSSHSLQDLDVQKLEKELTRKGKSQEEIQQEIRKLKRSGAKVDKKSKKGARKGDSYGDGGPYNSITVEGNVLFTDINGGTHPVRFATIQIFDQEAVPPDELVATTQTDNAGFYTVTIDDNDGDGTGRDIYVVVQANGDTVQVEDFASAGAIWELDSLPALTNVTDNTTQTINLTATNNAGSTQNVAFEVYEAINYLSRYLTQLGEPMPPKINVRLPNPGGGAYYDYVSIVLPSTEVHHWDAMQHEYGHHIQNLYNIADNPGGPHSSCSNDCVSQGSKDPGIRMAWAESWPTFFGSMAQNEMGLAALGIPEVGDVNYTSGNGLNYSLETETDGCTNGEGSERVIMRVLWDLYDNVNDDQDQGVALGAQVLWDLVTNNQPHTFSAFWNALVFGRTEAEKAAYGRILGRYGVAVQMTAPPDAQAYNGGAAPTFQWNAPVNCDSGGNTRYSIKFYNDAVTSLIYESPWQNTTSFTPSSDQLNQIFVGPAGNIRWLVADQDQSAPQTGNYYGLNRTVVDGFAVPDRNPVDIVLALDISGSMSMSVPGSTLNLQKLKLLQQAVEVFLRTWAMHAVTGDRIGILYFTTDISSLPGGPPAMLDVTANVDNIITDVNAKTPQACTAIGGVTQNAYQLLTGGTNKKVVILFTDGEQTHNPFIDEEGSPAKLKIRQIPAGSSLPFDAYWCLGSDAALDPSGNPISPDGQFLYEHDIQIHTIGVGVDGADFEELINRISSETEALHHFTSAPDEELDIFFTNDLINSLKTGSLEIVKTEKGSINKGGISSISVPVNSASVSLTLVISWKGELNPNALQPTVRTPSGASVTPEKISKGDFFSVLKYTFPLKTKEGALSHSGNWNISLRSQAQSDALLYQFTAIVDDRCFHYKFDFPRKNFGAGDTIALTATLTQKGKPLPKSTGVWVDVTAPVISPDNLLAEYLPKTRIDLGMKAESMSKPADHPDLVEMNRPFQRAVASLLQSNPKVNSQLRAKNISTIRLYDDGKKEHGDHKAGDGVYSNRLVTTQVAGHYQFKFKVLSPTMCGRVERTETLSTIVAANVFDPKRSHISFKPLQKNLYALTFRPQDKYGNLLGAGKARSINVLCSEGELKGAIVDNLDGSYQQLIKLAPNQDPHVVIVVRGQTLVSARLSSLMKRHAAKMD